MSTRDDGCTRWVVHDVNTQVKGWRVNATEALVQRVAVDDFESVRYGVRPWCQCRTRQVAIWTHRSIRSCGCRKNPHELRFVPCVRCEVQFCRHSDIVVTARNRPDDDDILDVTVEGEIIRAGCQSITVVVDRSLIQKVRQYYLRTICRQWCRRRCWWKRGRAGRRQGWFVRR